MSAPATITPVQSDIIKTASAILFVIDDIDTHPTLRQTTPLSDEQIRYLGRRFSDGLDRWNRDLRSGKSPNPIEVSRMAIVADLLSQRYATGVKRDDRNEITIPVNDIVDAWNKIGGDMSQFAESRQRWEGLIYALFPDNTVTTASQLADQVQNQSSTDRIGHAIAKSLGIDGIFNRILDAGIIPEAKVDPLPNYPPEDARSEHLQQMLVLQLELSVTEGMLLAITPDHPGETRTNQLQQWVEQRANQVIGSARGLLIPSGISRFSAQLDDTAKILTASRDQLRLCLYGAEAELAHEAAQHAVERSFWTTLFLALCPNIPFLIPTIELRLAITKPLFFVTRGAHEALGKIPIFGFPFWVMRGMGWLIDAVPRLQVRLVQGIVTDGWLADNKKRHEVIRRYLHYVDRRAMNPRGDAMQNVLLSIVQ